MDLEDAVAEGYIPLVRSFLWQTRHPFITATFLRLFSRTMVYGLLLSCLLVFHFHCYRSLFG